MLTHTKIHKVHNNHHVAYLYTSITYNNVPAYIGFINFSDRVQWIVKNNKKNMENLVHNMRK